jgi:hypothetical protein
LAAAQLRIGLLVWKRPELQSLAALYRRRLFWGWLLAGSVACYLAGVALGPDDSVRYLVRALLASWYTAALLPILVRPRLRQVAAYWLEVRTARWLGRFCFAALGLVVAAEATLRLYDMLGNQRVAAAYAAQGLTLSPGAQMRGRTVNRHGFWDDEFTEKTSTEGYRVAVLGDQAALAGDASTNFLTRIEQRMPDVEVFNFGLPRAGLPEYDVLLSELVLPWKPDLVVVLISIDSDITRVASTPGDYDLRGLRLYQWAASYGGLQENPPPAEHDTAPLPDREAFVEHTSQGLAICRVPLEESMRARWEQSLVQLEAMRNRCLKQQSNLALVLVPAPFQVNRRLCESARRSLGWREEQLDLDLPQRQLTDFARRREIAVLDLLPYLQASQARVHVRHTTEWNEQGNLVVAESMTQWLQSQFGPRFVVHANGGPH